mmetsp:Transcript_40650/g.65349  ORF Transcript_40650/g.65349 Transcript_40650/m.65349 type:complete len:375 (-) Transcript_40650:95-1219(-)
MMTPTGRTMGTISQSMKPLTPKLYTPASYTASSLQQRRRYAILTNAKILTMELPDSRVKKLVKIGTGMLPVVWTLYGTPLATALGASALYAALQIQDHNPVIENQVLPKAPAPTEKENEKKSNPQAFVINIEDLESPFSSPGDSPAAPPAPAAVASSPSSKVLSSSSSSPPPPPPPPQTLSSSTTNSKLAATSPPTTASVGVVSTSSSNDRNDDKVFLAAEAASPTTLGEGGGRRQLIKNPQSVIRKKEIKDETIGEILTRRLDPIKSFSMGEPSNQRTEKDVFRAFDPLGSVSDVKAPTGEFTLDPLPGGTRKKKAVKTEAEEAFYTKLDPVKQITKSLNEAIDKALQNDAKTEGKGLLWETVKGIFRRGGST